MVNAGLSLILLAVVLILLLNALERKKIRSNFRIIPSFDQLQRALNHTIEGGQGVQITLGRGSILSPQAGSTLAAVEMLASIARLCLNSDTPPLATSGDGSIALFSYETLMNTGQGMRSGARINPRMAQITGVSPFTYAAGTMLAQRNGKYQLAVALGNYGPEMGLLVDTAERSRAFFTGGTDNILAQSVLFASSRSVLIGEEFFSASGYIHQDSLHNASIKTQDILRIFLIIVIIIGAVLKAAGKL